jgi:hypothetical protein
VALGPGSAEQRYRMMLSHRLGCTASGTRERLAIPTHLLPGTSTRFHRYQFRSTTDQFSFILDAKCHLKLYAFG